MSDNELIAKNLDEILHLECHPPKIVKLSACSQAYEGASFAANGDSAMSAQAEIVKYHIKMNVIRTISAYATSTVFGLIAAALVVFAPESRSLATDIFAGAFLALSMGIAGFTRFAAKAPGLELGGSQREHKAR